MATDYGRKGGTSATAGKRSEVLRSPSTGLTKRVFKGQRWLVVAQRDEYDKTFLWAYRSEQDAKRSVLGCYKLGWDVHYSERAEVVSDMPIKDDIVVAS